MEKLLKNIAWAEQARVVGWGGKLPRGRTAEQGGARATEGWGTDAGGGVGRGRIGIASDVCEPGSFDSTPVADGLLKEDNRTDVV